MTKIDEATDDEFRALEDQLAKAEATIGHVRGVLAELERRERDSVSSDADAYSEAVTLLTAALEREDEAQ